MPTTFFWPLASSRKDDTMMTRRNLHVPNPQLRTDIKTERYKEGRRHRDTPNRHTYTHTRHSVMVRACPAPTFCSVAGNDNNQYGFVTATVMRQSKFDYWHYTEKAPSTGHLSLLTDLSQLGFMVQQASSTCCKMHCWTAIRTEPAGKASHSIAAQVTQSAQYHHQVCTMQHSIQY